MSDLFKNCSILYVGDLNIKVTEKLLLEKFIKFGEILSIRVCRDSNTKKCFGYAYVNFCHREEAQNALEELNHTCIYGQPCRIMWFEKDPSKRKSGIGNIVIKDLDEFTSIKEISDEFGAFGEITSCKLKTDSLGLPTGWAYVNYKNQEDAEKAIKIMDHKKLGENVITVEKYITKISNTKDELKCCYVENCSVYLDDNLLKIIFEKYGVVVTAKIMVNEDGVSKGFGFVTFKEAEDAAIATKRLNGQIIHNCKIHVYRVLSKKEVINTNLYINNLSKTIDQERLKKEFEVFGQISSVKVMVNPQNNKSYGYGFVSFHDQNSAIKALNEMNGKIVEGKTLFVAYNKTSSANRSRHNSEQLTNSSLNNEIKLLPLWSLPIMNQSFPLIQPKILSYPEHYGEISSFNHKNSAAITKQMIGDKIFSLIYNYAETKSVDVTRRLLVLDNNKLLNLIDNLDLLRMEVLSIIEDLNDEAQRNKNYMSEGQTNIKCNEAENSSKENTLDEFLSEEENGSKHDESVSDDEDSIEYKESLGCKLYPRVENISGDMVKDIISIFLKCSKDELIHMIENEDFLRKKINEEELKLRSTITADNVDSDTELYEKNIEIEQINNNPHCDLRTISEVTDIKESLEEKIYNLVIQNAGDLSYKVTDMFLKLEKAELTYMMENEEYFKKKIIEAKIEIENKKSSNTNDLTFENYEENDSLSEKQSSSNNAQSIPFMNKEPDMHFIQPFPEPMYRLMNHEQRDIHYNAMFQQRKIPRQVFPRPTCLHRSQPFYNITFPFTIPQQRFINTNQNARINFPPESLDVIKMLGEKLFSIINKHTEDSHVAGILTGMFLKYNKEVLINMMQNEDLLKVKIAETLANMSTPVTTDPKDHLRKETIKNLPENSKERSDTNLPGDRKRLMDENNKSSTKTFISGFGFN